MGRKHLSIYDFQFQIPHLVVKTFIFIFLLHNLTKNRSICTVSAIFSNLSSDLPVQIPQSFFPYIVCTLMVFDVNVAAIYLLKVNNRNIRTKCEIFSKFTIKIPEQSQIETLEQGMKYVQS